MKDHADNARFGAKAPESGPAAPIFAEAAETWEPTPSEVPAPLSDGVNMDVDIACVGFGPAMGGFLTTLTQGWTENPADPAFESKVLAGTPLQIFCYERADDLAVGVSGVVTRAKGIRATFPNLKPEEIPMAAEVTEERVLYLMDPIGASRRSAVLRLADFVLGLGRGLWVKDYAFELPWTPRFLHKHGGLVLSIGQFNQWVASQLMVSGLVQIWPASPVKGPLFAGRKVVGLRLADQGVDKKGSPADGFMPGMDVHARLTVVGDGPVGAVGRAIDERLGMPAGHARRDWAMGMKFVIELPPDESNPDALDKGSLARDGVIAGSGKEPSSLRPGTVWHTFGYPEPEIFGFLYVHPDRLVSVGIFVPSWMGNPARTAYRYLQHFIQHPALWRYLKNGTLRSWGAKSLEESGRRGEPFLAGNGYARIGEGSGSTNMLTGSGVDEAWTTGRQLAESVIELLREGKSFTEENLAKSYVARRRTSWVESAAREAEDARNGFHGGLVRGLVGMALAGLTGGHLHLKPRLLPSHKQIKCAQAAIENIERKRATDLVIEDGRPFHDALLSARGWPEIPFDGRLLVSHQDALLMGGKVQAMPGFADHVVFRDLRQCGACDEKTCVAMCSGQAITLGADNLPVFEREKCVHCGGCLWNCAKSEDGEHNNLEFRAGAGGLHSAEN
jgi:electron-transferring-flavoprotein dehydrogenase